jgi:two-component system alkaline phosphatase synthesis response regulator PhoP
MAGERILVVDDEPRYLEILRFNLEAAAYRVACAATGAEALEALEADEPELIVLDLMLPDLDGFALCGLIRDRSSCPIIMLTAKGAEEDKVRGLRLGADDYVTKPFSTAELVARVRALLRRSSLQPATGAEGEKVERFGQIEVNPDTRMVRRNGEVVELTPKEFDLLLALIRRRGAVASRSELLKEVWRYGNADIMTRTVDVHVAELRRKLEEDPAKPRHILTARKAGYRLQP